MSASASARLAVDAGSPEWRAALFGQAIAYAAHLAGPICPHALHKHLRSFLGQSEGRCGGEVCDAVLMLLQTGLFTANTVDPETGIITFGEGTMLTVAPLLTGYLYGEGSEV